MKINYIDTDNYIKLLESFQALKKLPKDAPRIGLGFGNFGLGKTFALEKITAKERAILLRATQTWSKSSLLETLANELELDTKGSASLLFNRIIEELLENPRIIIIDEIDTLLKADKVSVLELLRDIHDLTSIVLFFVGMEEANAKFKRYRHYYSRITALVQFLPISKSDIEKFCSLSEVKIEVDLIDYFANKYPNLRQLKVLILRLEEFAQLQDLTSINFKTFKESGVENGLKN